MTTSRAPSIHDRLMRAARRAVLRSEPAPTKYAASLLGICGERSVLAHRGALSDSGTSRTVRGAMEAAKLLNR
mgnify:CR=1 FL=1